MTAQLRATPAAVSLAAALVPFLAVHACYLVAASQGHVDWCNPYWDGCTSISKTGRKVPEYYLFKAAMIPAAVLMILHWRHCGRWLAGAEPDPSRSARIIPWLGLVCGVFLIIYTVALGHRGDEFRLARRIGVILHFSMAYLAMLLFTARLAELRRSGRVAVSGRLYAGMWCCCVLALGIGIVHNIAEAIDPRYDDWEDAVEWNVALCINLHYFLVARLWFTVYPRQPAR